MEKINFEGAFLKALFWSFIKYLGIFIIGGVGYGVLEIIWRGHTHYSMALAGGIVLCGGYFINRFHKGASLFLRWLAVALMILTVELVFGVIFNMLLGLAVWDYSDMPFNFYGQICLLYGFFWFIISAAVCFGFDLHCRYQKNRENGEFSDL